MTHTEQPNILHIVADDLGWADFAHRGAPIRTPHLDRFAAESIELSRFYVCPVCSPTRSALMTGRYPHRFGMGGSPMQFAENKGLPPDLTTLPQVLGEAGYRHRHAIGKWHLGNSATCFHPVRRGFTSFYGHYCGAICYWTHTRADQLDWHRDEASDYTPGYSTRLMADDAVRFIRDTPAKEPWYLYLAFNAVHTPLQAPEETIRSYDGVDLKGYDQTYCAMMTEMDAGIGRVLAMLEERGLSENTLVVFHSDNGGVGHHGLGSNLPFRGHKGTVYEGGVRVCAWARWPQRWEQPGRCEAVMGHVDLLPTFAAAAHATAPADIDGLNALPWIDKTEAQAERLFHPDGIPRTGYALIGPRWKLKDEELYDLENDPSETTDLAATHPEIQTRMKQELARIRALSGPAYLPPGMPENKETVPFEWKMAESGPMGSP